MVSVWKEYDIGTTVIFVCFASKVTEIDRISVVMYVSDQFVDGKMQLTHYQDPSTKLGFWVGTRLKRQENDAKTPKYSGIPWRMNVELKESLTE